jgi:hypothetical protein
MREGGKEGGREGRRDGESEWVDGREGGRKGGRETSRVRITRVGRGAGGGPGRVAQKKYAPVGAGRSKNVGGARFYQVYLQVSDARFYQVYLQVACRGFGL